jgi:hypothetical protein
MKILSLLLLSASLLVLPVACKSSKSKSASAASVPCNCGTPMGDLEGCANPVCMSGKHNPDNPKCVCGNIDIPDVK